jgi:hypothetical protein
MAATPTNPPLTPDQLNWFKQRRDIIWLADYWARLGDPTSLRALSDHSRHSPSWHDLFGDMNWEEAYTRYKRMLISRN